MRALAQRGEGVLHAERLETRPEFKETPNSGAEYGHSRNDDRGDEPDHYRVFDRCRAQGVPGRVVEAFDQTGQQLVLLPQQGLSHM